MKIKSNEHSALKWAFIGTVLIILVVGGYFSLQYYQDYRANKVYSVGETIRFPDFKVKITKSEFKPVDLPLDKESIAKYGSADKHEDCSKQSKEKTWWKAWDNDPGAPMVKLGPSDYDICIKRNDSRDAINKYTKTNSQLAVNYEITAINNIDFSGLQIKLVPDSGRQINKQSDPFKGNQFFRDGGAQYKSDLLAEQLQSPGPVYTSELQNSLYETHAQSKLTGDLDKGLQRTGYIHADIRKSEHSVDVKITYKNDTRIVRITR